MELSTNGYLTVPIFMSFQLSHGKRFRVSFYVIMRDSYIVDLHLKCMCNRISRWVVWKKNVERKPLVQEFNSPENEKNF